MTEGSPVGDEGRGMTLGQTVVTESYMKSNPLSKIINYATQLGEFDPTNEEGRVHGKSNPARSLEPGMGDLLRWEYDDFFPNDYTKGDRRLKHRIRKSAKDWVTENRDNFREHVYSPEKGRYYFDYLQTSEEKHKRPRKPRDQNEAYKTVYQIEYDRVVEAMRRAALEDPDAHAQDAFDRELGQDSADAVLAQGTGGGADDSLDEGQAAVETAQSGQETGETATAKAAGGKSGAGGKKRKGPKYAN